MSAAVVCDNCGTSVPKSADELLDWLTVQWNQERFSSDYCTAACAVAGIEAGRDERAAEAMAAMDDEDDS